MNSKEKKIFVVIALIFQVKVAWAQVPPPPTPVELSINSNLYEMILIALILGFMLYKKYNLQKKAT